MGERAYEQAPPVSDARRSEIRLRGVGHGVGLGDDCSPCSCALVDFEREREAVDAVMRRERAADLHVLAGVTAGLVEPPEREDDRRGRLVDLGQMVEIVDPRPQLEPLFFNPCGRVRIAEVVEHAPGAAAERVRLQLDVAEPRCEVLRLGRRRLSPAQIDRPAGPRDEGPPRAQGCRAERARAPGRSSRRPEPAPAAASTCRSESTSGRRAGCTRRPARQPRGRLPRVSSASPSRKPRRQNAARGPFRSGARAGRARARSPSTRGHE